jgi:hypothetical protein
VAGNFLEKVQHPVTFVVPKKKSLLTFQLSPARTHEARMHSILGKKARMRAAATGSYWHKF